MPSNKHNKPFIIWFEDITINDIPIVGGKNAALGEMFTGLKSKGINVPNGFAVTAEAYNHFLDHGDIREKIKTTLTELDTKDIKDLEKRGAMVRKIILEASFSQKLEDEIKKAYKNLNSIYGENTDTAVRSSATAEDLPDASFAGQQETYLNVSGEKQIVEAVKKCFASLFTNRAISYRTDKGFSHFDVALSVAVQKMVRSDLASSGVMFTIDTETGFENVVIINASYGLGEMIVQGKVTPDEYMVFKPMLNKSPNPIISKEMGDKDIKMIYGKKANDTQIVKTSKKESAKFCLSDEEIIALSKWGAEIEKYFSEKKNRKSPMDIEWAKDGKTNELFIVQARPETVHSTENKKVYTEYELLEKGDEIVLGTAVGTKIGQGKARVIKNVSGIHSFKAGEVLVTEMTDPDWEPIMKIAGAIVTDKGGRTSHAAIVSRELGIPAIVGTKNATSLIKTGEDITVDCASGKTGIIYKGNLKFRIKENHLDEVPETKTQIMVNIGTPDEAFSKHFLPVKGVGLGRLEFIIGSHIQIHPNALIDFEKNKKSDDRSIRHITKKIEKLTQEYKDKKKYYIDNLAGGIAKIGAAFWPNKVIIRFSDFKTNEYRTLIGGGLYEPKESNPMIGWRGASRYYDPKFKEAFGLECLALKKVRDDMGLQNIIPMIPFVEPQKRESE